MSVMVPGSARNSDVTAVWARGPGRCGFNADGNAGADLSGHALCRDNERAVVGEKASEAPGSAFGMARRVLQRRSRKAMQMTLAAALRGVLAD